MTHTLPLARSISRIAVIAGIFLGFAALSEPAHGACKVAQPQTAIPVSDDGPAGLRGGAPARPAFVKGWVERARAGQPFDLPAGARTIEAYGDRLFVEIPTEAAASLHARGLLFHAVEDADILTAGGERFDVSAGEPPLSPEWRASAPPVQRRPYLVKFDAPVKAEWIADLEGSGFEVVQYQPQFGYLLFAPPDVEARLKGVRHLAFNGEYHGAYKTHAALKARVANDETITLRLVLFDLPGWERRVDALVLGGARLTEINEGPSTSQWKVLHHVTLENVRTRDLPAILRDPEVYWAEEWFPPQPEDERAAQIIAGNYAAGAPLTGYHTWLAGLAADGAGVTVAIADTGFDNGSTTTQHPDLRGRTTYATGLCSNNRDTDGHGTNTASIAVGDPRLPTGTGLTDSLSFYWGAGAAPGATLYVQKALNNGDCSASWAGQPNVLAADAVRSGGAKIGSHSFQDGLTPGNGYTSTAQAWDARVRDADPNTSGNQPYAVVFSAGNSGPAAGTLTSPHAAKNMVTVGATENYRPGACPGISGCGGSADDLDALYEYSSRGPTVDGRIKPDIVAPGHVIAGARSSVVTTYDCYCDSISLLGCCASLGVDGSSKYTLYSGTSQASPRVGGASAIVFDWYKDRFSVFPSPAMDKGILINGAVDLKTPNVPNSNEGWGRIDLKSSLQSSVPSMYVDQTTIIGTTGDPSAFTANYYVQDPTKPLKGTLVWTDSPGAVSCNPCLVNDLDLLLTQGTTTWRGNNFTSGFSNTGTTPDTLNNVEGIHLTGQSLTCASFQVKVRAQTLNGDGVPGNADTTDQDFALVVANAGTTVGPPVLKVSSAALSGGCDGDAFLDRRETAALTIQIGNPGCTGATGVQATVSVHSAPPGAVVTVSPTGPETIGAIGSGGSASHGWQISLADYPSSFCGQKVRLRIDLTDSLARSWTEYTEIMLDTDSFSTVTNTDPATVDNSFYKDADWSLRSCRTTSSPTSWHMGATSCSGIPNDATMRDLIFAYTPSTGDVIKELSFQHAFNGYYNTTYGYYDSVQVDIDPENDGTYVTLQTWRQGIDNPTTMTLAGPFDLTPYNATRAGTVKIRFRFTSAANWAPPNKAAGWDVDDIVFKKDAVVCDGGSCPTCSNPSGLGNNTAADANSCYTSGIDVTWPQDPGSWNDPGGTRTYTVLRGGIPIASGPCSGVMSYGTTSCTDTTAAAGVSYTYQVRYTNSCPLSATTAGAAASDLNCAPPAVGDGSSGGNPLTVTKSGTNLTLAWDPAAGATRYNIYKGSIGGYFSHAIFTAAGLDGADSCFEPASSATFAIPAGSVYFLVSADNGIVESVLGDSTPVSRPYASPACSPH